jgi:hypothetical protein
VKVAAAWMIPTRWTHAETSEASRKQVASARHSDIGNYIMADQTFLKHLNYFQRFYKPRKLAVSDVVINEMEYCFKQIGITVQEDDPHKKHKSVINHLYRIASHCFDMIGTEDYQKFFEDIIVLHTNKNAGYAGLGATDPWANFRQAEWYGVSPFVGCMIRMGDKLIRISNLYKNPECDKVNESIKDAMYDLGVYCFIAICLWEEENQVIKCTPLQDDLGYLNTQGLQL